MNKIQQCCKKYIDINITKNEWKKTLFVFFIFLFVIGSVSKILFLALGSLIILLCFMVYFILIAGPVFEDD